MIKKLINPFQYLAGLKSLILGIAIILVTSIVGYFSNTQFPDIISVKTCPDSSISYYITRTSELVCFVDYVLHRINDYFKIKGETN